MAQSDNILLQRFALTGDAQAFSELVGQNAGVVYGVCMRILGDSEAAADAAQETFFQLLKSAGSVTGSVSSWLHRVATNKAVDLIRRDSSRRKREAEYAGRKQVQVERWEDVSPYVDEAMDELDDETRDILVAYFLKGLTTGDVAAQRGVSQPTVSRRIDGGVAKLRKNLQKRGVILGGIALSTLLANSATEAVPAVVMTELGKMAIAGGTAAGVGAKVAGLAAMGVKAKIITAVAVAAVGAGSVVTYNVTREPEPVAREVMQQPENTGVVDEPVEERVPTVSRATSAAPKVEGGNEGGYGYAAVEPEEEIKPAKDKVDEEQFFGAGGMMAGAQVPMAPAAGAGSDPNQESKAADENSDSKVRRGGGFGGGRARRGGGG